MSSTRQTAGMCRFLGAGLMALALGTAPVEDASAQFGGVVGGGGGAPVGAPSGGGVGAPRATQGTRGLGRGGANMTPDPGDRIDPSDPGSAQAGISERLRRAVGESWLGGHPQLPHQLWQMGFEPSDLDSVQNRAEVDRLAAAADVLQPLTTNLDPVVAEALNLKALSMIAAAAGSDDTFLTVVNQGLATALTVAAYRDMPRDAVRLTGQNEWIAMNDPAALKDWADRLDLSPEERDRLVALPIRVGTDPVLGLLEPGAPRPTPKNGGRDFGLSMIQSVGGDKVEDVGAISFDAPAAGAPLTPAGDGASVLGDGGSVGEPARFCGTPGAAPCYHFVVSLHRDNQVRCSGALVGAQWVLTAAHCVCGATPNRASIGSRTPDRRSYGRSLTATVHLSGNLVFFDGATAAADSAFCAAYADWAALPADDPRRRQAAAEAFRHRDLALLHLARPLRFRPGPSAIDVPNDALTAPVAAEAALDEANAMTVIGFGANDWQPTGGVKTFVGLNVAADGCDLATESAGATFCDPENEFVLRDPLGVKDSCYGDSGAAAVVMFSQHGPVIAGLVPRDATRTGGCGAGGIYAKTGKPDVLAWLSTTVPDLKIVPAGDPLLASYAGPRLPGFINQEGSDQ
ncbi:MAG: trypsin-like serine protease [Pseudomonadota bacterium]